MCVPIYLFHNVLNIRSLKKINSNKENYKTVSSYITAAFNLDTKSTLFGYFILRNTFTYTCICACLVLRTTHLKSFFFLPPLLTTFLGLSLSLSPGFSCMALSSSSLSFTLLTCLVLPSVSPPLLQVSLAQRLYHFQHFLFTVFQSTHRFSLFYSFYLCLLTFLLHARPFYNKLSVYLSPSLSLSLCLAFFLSFSLPSSFSRPSLFLFVSLSFPLSVSQFFSLSLYFFFFLSLSLQLFTKLLYQAMKSPSEPGDSIFEEGTLRVCYKQRYYTMHRRLI